ncbi:MAG TPA: DUF5666 domain-containing protein [Ideonella sp.]|uniref:DUF5666 domain-containing protein n=1 Tax=Ideonella sp. TaxID=1929293 RepID=UPI002C950E07|nr:DUF5666 domain-containing protein [Ideonella sp.]HSI47287.1 DUF5666 domain-containing protein [Ideonella sp.]
MARMTERPGRRWRTPFALACSLAALLLAACGGVEGGGTGASPQGYAEGSATGLGGLIVNGVNYEQRSARIADDQGHLLGADTLRLGMVMRIDSSAVGGDEPSAEALQVTVSSALTGPVSASDLMARSLTVLGQTVLIDGATAFDPAIAGGQAGIALGDAVEVHAIYDAATGRYLARRIEPRSSPASYGLQGRVQALDLATRTLQMGGQPFQLSTRMSLPAGLTDGAFVKLLFDTQPDAHGRWRVRSVLMPAQRDAATGPVALQGLIEQLDGSSLRVGGLRVDLRQAQVLPAGSVLQTGLRVRVEGSASDGVVRASTLTVKPVAEDGDRVNKQNFSLVGQLSALDLAAQRFTLLGTPVSFADTVLSQGTESALANGVRIEVRGTLSLDGTSLVAQGLKFDP